MPQKTQESGSKSGGGLDIPRPKGRASLHTYLNKQQKRRLRELKLLGKSENVITVAVAPILVKINSTMKPALTAPCNTAVREGVY